MPSPPPSASPSPLFVAFEGGDACGKSTQAKVLAESLGALLTREPGGTPISERLRELVLDPEAILDDRTEALVMAASRAQLVAEVIRPALESGQSVVTDRYIGSSLAYQGYGRGLPLDAVRYLSEFATDQLWPDLIVLIDIPVEVARERMRGPKDRIERSADDFHQRLRDGYLALAAADPQRWSVVDGTGSPDEVTALVHEEVSRRYPL